MTHNGVFGMLIKHEIQVYQLSRLDHDIGQIVFKLILAEKIQFKFETHFIVL